MPVVAGQSEDHSRILTGRLSHIFGACRWVVEIATELTCDVLVVVCWVFHWTRDIGSLRPENDPCFAVALLVTVFLVAPVERKRMAWCVWVVGRRGEDLAGIECACGLLPAWDLAMFGRLSVWNCVCGGASGLPRVGLVVEWLHVSP